MTAARYMLSKSSRPEREVILALRAVAYAARAPIMPTTDGALRTAALTAIDTLVAQATAKGFAFRPIEAPHVAEDELKLLGWLAFLQRDRPEDCVAIDADLREPLIACAHALRRAGLHLPYRAVLRVAAARESFDRGREALPTDTGTWQRAPITPRAISRYSLKAGAIAFAREHGCVSTRQFGEIGISRQYLAKLCIDGDLLRVRFGHYRAPSPCEAAPTESPKATAPFVREWRHRGEAGSRRPDRSPFANGTAAHRASANR